MFFMTMYLQHYYFSMKGIHYMEIFFNFTRKFLKRAFSIFFTISTICIGQFLSIGESRSNEMAPALKCCAIGNVSKKEPLVKIKGQQFIYGINGVRFFLPNYPEDFIQRLIVERHDYFEGDTLRKLDSYIPEDAVILDIGANIGNHTLYWAKQNKIKKVYSFEPVKSTFEVLKTNVDLNEFNNKVKLLNIGLSDQKTKAIIEIFHKENIGGTHIKDTPDGDMDVDKLDNIEIKENRIDFVKIDVESHEVQVLNGASETFRKYKPKYVFIESFPDKFEETKKILESYGYRLTDFPVQYCNYLFEYKG